MRLTDAVPISQLHIGSTSVSCQSPTISKRRDIPLRRRRVHVIPNGINHVITKVHSEDATRQRDD